MDAGGEAEFWEIASGLDDEEARTRALDYLAADRPSFADLLRRRPPGEVISVFTVDGASVRGRVLEVGPDVVRVGEVADGTGTARRRILRCHDVRLNAVVRIVRDVGT